MNEPVSVDIPASQKNLLHLAQRGGLDLRAYERALKIIGFTPNAQKWNRFLDILLLVLGAGLTVSGIYFFFAYNWDAMHRFVKLGIIEALILGLVIAASRLAANNLPGKITLTVAGVMIGALLAVYGQIYQTGADVYTLFLGWTILMAGWVFVSRFTPMWFIWILLINTTLLLYWSQMVGYDNGIYAWVFSLNGLFVLAWEFFHGKTDWLASRWTPRIISLAVFYAITVPALILVTGEWQWSRDPIMLVMAILFVIFIPIVIYIYSQKMPDLFMLTLSAISLMTVFTAWMGNLLDGLGDFTPLVLGLLVIGQTALVVTLLLRVSKSWEARTK